MNYRTQLEHLEKVQDSLKNTKQATRQALNELVMRLLGEFKAKLETVELALFWEEEFTNNKKGILTTKIELIVTVSDGPLSIASFIFDPRDAASIAIFNRTFEESMANILKAKSMVTNLKNKLPEKEETLPRRKPKI